MTVRVVSSNRTKQVEERLRKRERDERRRSGRLPTALLGDDEEDARPRQRRRVDRSAGAAALEGRFTDFTAYHWLCGVDAHWSLCVVWCGGV